MSLQPLYTATAHAHGGREGRVHTDGGPIAVPDVSITCMVTIGKTDAGGYGLAAELHGHFTGVDRETAQQLMAGAHQVCPYSNATRGNIEVKLVVAEPQAAT